MAERLARFRVDPSRVRVSLRAESGGWRVKLSVRPHVLLTGMRHPVPKHVRESTAWALNPKHAVDVALRSAQMMGMPGIDLDMQEAYPHPQGSKEK